ncbi:MAG: class I SAM-dependent DNA methyltransferase [Veillonellales bacterium]
MQNYNQTAEFLWKIADLIRDYYEETAYEDVILPFTLLRRLDCVLETRHEQVTAEYEKFKTAPPETLKRLLCRAAGQNFYNTSEFTLTKLTKAPADIGENFGKYLDGFSDNIKDILYNFSGGEEKGLSPLYETLLRKNLLLVVTQAFTEADLSPEAVDNHAVGTIFEYLIRKFKEARNAAAGQHYTPRDVIRLMVSVMFAPDIEHLKQAGRLVSLYDPACGTGGMLTEGKEYLLKHVKSDLEVYLYGQEIQEKTYAMCKADTLMKGEQADNIKQGNTLSEDQLKGKTFNYMLSNPPFGEDWKNISSYIEAQAELGYAGRFGAGLPGIDDGSLLFLQHMISKMDETGSKIAIVFNGSPLFNGDAGSGPSNIRKWIIENDWLDAIIAMPGDLFYNTNIATYIWLLDNRKPPDRAKKVQMINASTPEYYQKLKSSLGKKMVEMGGEQIEAITKLYLANQPGESCRIFEGIDFGYTKVTVERPLRLSYTVTPAKLDILSEQKNFIKLALSNNKDQKKKRAAIEAGQAKQKQLQAALLAIGEQGTIKDDGDFFARLEKRVDFKLSKAMLKELRDTFGEKDETAAMVYTDYQLEPDPELRDAEYIPLKENIEEYFAREVKPHVPDAWMDRDKDKIGYEINFTRYFYQYQPLRSIDVITADLLAVETETDGLLSLIVNLTGQEAGQ